MKKEVAKLLVALPMLILFSYAIKTLTFFLKMSFLSIFMGFFVYYSWKIWSW